MKLDLMNSLSRKYSLPAPADGRADDSVVDCGRQFLAGLDRHLHAEQARVEDSLRTSRETLQAHEKKYTDAWEEQKRCELDFTSKVESAIDIKSK
jgi:hypothetical protein